MLVLGIDGLSVDLALRWGVTYKHLKVFKLPREWVIEPITMRFWLGISGCKTHLHLDTWWEEAKYIKLLHPKIKSLYRRVNLKRKLITLNIDSNIDFIYYPLIAWDEEYHLTLYKLLIKRRLKEYLRLVYIHNKYRVRKYMKKYDASKLTFLWLDIVDHYAHLGRLGMRVKIFIKWAIRALKPDIIISDHGTTTKGHIPIAFITAVREDDIRRWVWGQS